MANRPNESQTQTQTQARPSSDTSPVPDGDSPWEVGKSYFVRTVTMFLVGRLAAVYGSELLFERASWVADTGRFHDALASGTLNEVEPFVARVIVGRGSVVDATEWRHELPSAQK